MPSITYFQRYSTKENAVTNTTLHLFSQIYNHSPDRLKGFLSELFGNETIPLGLDFVQQTRSDASVPDGVIHQEPVHILIETKVTAGVDSDQLIRHCRSFNPKIQGNFLILLTKETVPDTDVATVHDTAKEYAAIFRKTTFEELCKALENVAREHETHLKSIVNDFVAYCAEMGLLIDRRRWLSIVPCGKTFDLNEKWQMYYQPTDRGYTPQDYLGIYTDKAVWLIGKITATYDNELDEHGTMHLKLFTGEDRTEFRDRIDGMIKETKEQVGWDLTSGTRFFCVANFFETEFKKTSPGGIMGGRYWDITEQLKSASSDEILAQNLRKDTWD